MVYPELIVLAFFNENKTVRNLAELQRIAGMTNDQLFQAINSLLNRKALIVSENNLISISDTGRQLLTANNMENYRGKTDQHTPLKPRSTETPCLPIRFIESIMGK